MARNTAHEAEQTPDDATKTQGFLPPASHREADEGRRKSGQRLFPAPIQKAAAAVATLFAVIGLVAFLPGVTTHTGEIEAAGTTSMALLFGVFSVSLLHNVIHLLFAVIGFSLGTAPGGARAFLRGGGALYLIVALYGALFLHTGANFVPFNTADNWLHLALGLGMIGLTFLPVVRERGDQV